ncbi:MAG: hypothetical protein IJZ00_05715 [Lachnospiraceae bacterium]|nr:hypothetical protein [Lachnospiraceae bacterium]
MEIIKNVSVLLIFLFELEGIIYMHADGKSLGEEAEVQEKIYCTHFKYGAMIGIIYIFLVSVKAFFLL